MELYILYISIFYCSVHSRCANSCSNAVVYMVYSVTRRTEPCAAMMLMHVVAMVRSFRSLGE